MKFTVGMALYTDHACPTEAVRCAFTVMSLAVHHPLVEEVVVVDNNPGPGSAGVRTLLSQLGGKGTYVEMPSPKGTAAPRNRVFEVAKNQNVVCIDSHVLLHPGCLEAVRDTYLNKEVGPDDLVHGPMMNEDGTIHATHMNDEWRSEMWGTWGIAWRKPLGRGQYVLFSCRDLNGKVQYVSLDTDGEQVKEESNLLPVGLAWPGHEAVLEKAGCERATASSRWPAFRVPGHGMGFFACSKDAWVRFGHFHPDALGFGGEEVTTGYRFRKHGKQVYCVLGAKWWHHFNRGTPPYRLTAWDKVRNYVLEFQRLGMDPNPVKEHFVDSGRISEDEYEQAIRGITWPVLNPNKTSAETYVPRPADVPEPDKALTAEFLARATQSSQKSEAEHVPQNGKGNVVVVGLGGYYDLLAQDAGLSPDMDLCRGLAAMGGRNHSPAHVIELGTGHGQLTTALLAGAPRSLTTYDVRIFGGRAHKLLKHLVPGGTTYRPLMGMVDRLDLSPVDLIVYRPDQADEDLVFQVLSRHADRTMHYVVQGVDSSDAVLTGVKKFLIARPAWAAAHRVHSDAGTILLTRDENFQWPPPGGVLFPQLTLAQPQGHVLVVPEHGPGTELAEALKVMGIENNPACSCKARMAQMNQWGVQGCRDHLEEIVTWLKEGQEAWGWKDKLKAVGRAVTSGLGFHLNPLDPFRSLIDLAIKRAEEKESKKESARA